MENKIPYTNNTMHCTKVNVIQIIIPIVDKIIRYKKYEKLEIPEINSSNRNFM